MAIVCTRQRQLGVNFFFFSSRRRHTRSLRDWSSDVCSSDLHPKIRELSGKGGNEWTFRVALDDEIMAHTFARYIARTGVKSSSILAMNNDFGRGAAIAYEAAFKKVNVKLLSTEFF